MAVLLPGAFHMLRETRLPPIDRFARRFDNPEGKPAFAILLIDTGAPDLDRAALAALPFPVTFAIDPTLPDAGTFAATYRAAGQEVVMLAAGIPQGATASDLEVTFAANADALPEAVAVLDLPSGGFQSDRPLATLVVPVVAVKAMPRPPEPLLVTAASDNPVPLIATDPVAATESGAAAL